MSPRPNCKHRNGKCPLSPPQNSAVSCVPLSVSMSETKSVASPVSSLRLGKSHQRSSHTFQPSAARPPRKRHAPSKNQGNVVLKLAYLDKLPVELIQKIVGCVKLVFTIPGHSSLICMPSRYLPMVHLRSIINLSSTCKYLRDTLRSNPPWVPSLQALAAPMHHDPFAPRPKRSPTCVDPYDLKRDPYKLLAKYGGRLCFGCHKLQDNRADVVQMVAPTILLDLLAFPSRLNEEKGRWSEIPYEDDPEEPHAPTTLCNACAKKMWTMAWKSLADNTHGWVHKIPGCAEPWAKAQGNWMNKKNSEYKYKLYGKLDGVKYRAVVIAQKRIGRRN